MSNARYDWLDIAKGVTIILMVLGHGSIPKFASNFIWAFHMPLFFIASGFCTNWECDTFVCFVKKKAKSIILPFCLYSIIVALIFQVLDARNWPDILLNGWDGYALWFIPVLYFASIGAKVVFSIQNKFAQMLAIVSVIGLAYASGYFKPHLPWTLYSVPYACMFIIIGTKLKEWFLSNSLLFPPPYVNKYGKSSLLISVSGICFIITFAVSHYSRLDMCFNKLLPFVPITIGAITGTMFIFTLSALLERYLSHGARMLKDVGKETYVVVAFSQIIIMMQNEWFAYNALIKYAVLVVALITIVKIKNYVNQIIGTRIL